MRQDYNYGYDIIILSIFRQLNFIELFSDNRWYPTARTTALLFYYLLIIDFAPMNNEQSSVGV